MENKKMLEVTKSIPGAASAVFGAIRDGVLFKTTGLEEKSFKSDFREGGKYELEWKSGGKCSGRYIQIIPDRIVCFTWNSVECKGGTNKDTQVTITLESDGKNCLLKLVHEGLDSGFSYEDHLKGWTSSLDDLAKSNFSTGEYPLKSASACNATL